MQRFDITVTTKGALGVSADDLVGKPLLWVLAEMLSGSCQTNVLQPQSRSPQLHAPSLSSQAPHSPGTYSKRAAKLALQHGHAQVCAAFSSGRTVSPHPHSPPPPSLTSPRVPAFAGCCTLDALCAQASAEFTIDELEPLLEELEERNCLMYREDVLHLI